MKATVRKNTDLDFIVVDSCYIAIFYIRQLLEQRRSSLLQINRSGTAQLLRGAGAGADFVRRFKNYKSLIVPAPWP
jgi:hypothetical protein